MGENVPGAGRGTKDRLVEPDPVVTDADRLAREADSRAAAGEYAAAIETYERCLRMGSGTPELHHNLGRALHEMGEASRAARHFETAAASCDAIDPWLALATLIPGCPGASGERILEVRRAFAARLDALAPVVSDPDSRPPDSGDGRIRIGYLSGFFHRPNYMKPVWALIRNHDRSAFQVHLLSDGEEREMPGFSPRPGDVVHWTVATGNRDLVELIRSSGIQILVDLNGYSFPARLPLFVQRPAPVTVAWFNMYATSGLGGIQYVVGDRQVVRPGEEDHFTERVLCLPVSYLTFEVAHDVPPVAPPPCLRGGSLVFGSLASQYKIGPEVLDTWAEILRRLGNAHLLIANATLSSEGNRAYVRDRFAERGVGADRLVLLGPASYRRFLEYYGRIDVALDPFPYSGGTTTMEALWQGVPVLTIKGDRWASRTTRSLLHHGGLGGFVARNVAGLVDQAVALGRDPATPARLSCWRSSMRQRLGASSVCNGAALARHMERLYRAILRNVRSRG